MEGSQPQSPVSPSLTPPALSSAMACPSASRPGPVRWLCPCWADWSPRHMGGQGHGGATQGARGAGHIAHTGPSTVHGGPAQRTEGPARRALPRRAGEVSGRPADVVRAGDRSDTQGSSPRRGRGGRWRVQRGLRPMGKLRPWGPGEDVSSSSGPLGPPPVCSVTRLCPLPAAAPGSWEGPPTLPHSGPAEAWKGRVQGWGWAPGQGRCCWPGWAAPRRLLGQPGRRLAAGHRTGL